METLNKTNQIVFISPLDMCTFDQGFLASAYWQVRKNSRERNCGLPCLLLFFYVVIFRISGWLIQRNNTSEKGCDRAPWQSVSVRTPPPSLGGSDRKESACNEGDLGSIPGSGRSPGEGNGYPLQYSFLENYKDRGAWWGYSPWGRRESWQWLSDSHAIEHFLHWKPVLVLLGGMVPSPLSSSGLLSPLSSSGLLSHECNTPSWVHFDSPWGSHVLWVYWDPCSWAWWGYTRVEWPGRPDTAPHLLLTCLFHCLSDFTPQPSFTDKIIKNFRIATAQH